MKITKRQLRRIIKEEKSGLMSEQRYIEPGQEGMAIVMKLEELEEALAGVRNPEEWAERKFRSLPGFLENVENVLSVLYKMQ